MKTLFFLLPITVILLASCSGTSTIEVARISSPDGQKEAVVTLKQQHESFNPTPDAPDLQAQWLKLDILSGNKTLFTTGFEGLERYDHVSEDAIWSPDSTKVAYRLFDQFRIITTQGKCDSYDVCSFNRKVSSYRWRNKDELLLVSKHIDSPGPFYPGFFSNTKGIQILKLTLGKGTTERYRQTVDEPMFLCHTSSSLIEEISPSVNRVAFSDGHNICVYDDSTGTIIAKEPVEGSVSGIWWVNDDKLVLYLSVPSNTEQEEQFYTFDIPSNKLEDVTSKLYPDWHGYDKPNWFRPALQQQK